VSDQEKKDRSAALVPGQEPAATPSGGGGATPAPEAGLAGALASALEKRKAKVSHSGESAYLLMNESLLTAVQMMRMTMMTGE
jgi:Wiskott-Aldrich syndrome protein